MSFKSETFQNELMLINNPEHRIFASRCLESAPGYFFEIPASSTGKYHPAYSLGVGGLVRHTKAAVKIANNLLQLDMFKAFQKARDEIITALILHDTCKSGKFGFEQGGFTVTTHPLLAADLVMACANDAAAENERPTFCEYNAELPDGSDHWDYVDLVCECIRTHMGQWREDYKTKKTVLPEMKYKIQRFVHMCDYLASRKCLTVTNDDGTDLK